MDGPDETSRTAPSTPIVAESGAGRSHHDIVYLPEQEQEVSILELANVLLRHWRLVVMPALVAAVLMTIVSIIIPPTFEATTAFVPETERQGQLPAGLAGLAGQFGVSLGTEANESPQFYAEVIRSRDILNRILLTPFHHPRSDGQANDTTVLLRILNVDGDNLADSLHNGRQALDDLVSVDVSSQTNIVTLSVASHYPSLAAQVANRLVDYLSEFNTHSRQSRAGERRRFIEGRLSAAETELSSAEQAIKQFYERNRTWEQSHQLRFEHEQLQRRVQIRQELALTLRREYETTRIAEVNDTPVLTVIYAASPPQERSRPKRKILVALALVLGGGAGIIAAFVREIWTRGRQQSEGAYAEFSELVDRMRDDVRRLITRSSQSRSQ